MEGRVGGTEGNERRNERSDHPSAGDGEEKEGNSRREHPLARDGKKKEGNSQSAEEEDSAEQQGRKPTDKPDSTPSRACVKI